MAQKNKIILLLSFMGGTLLILILWFSTQFVARIHQHNSSQVQFKKQMETLIEKHVQDLKDKREEIEHDTALHAQQMRRHLHDIAEDMELIHNSVQQDQDATFKSIEKFAGGGD